MNRFKLTLCVYVLSVPLPALAQERPAEDATAQQTDEAVVSQLENEVKKNVKQFEQLLLKRAADLSHPNHLVAVELLGQQKQQFEELNLVIEHVFENVAADDPGSLTKRSQAISLIPLSTIDKSKKVRFVLDTIQSYSVENVHSPAGQRQSKKILSQYPEETFSQILERLKQPNANRAMAELLQVVSMGVPLTQLNQATAPLIVLAGSDDTETAESAMYVTSRLQSEIDQRVRQKRIALSKPVLPQGMDEKYLKYSQRIIGRYDKNNDNALTPSEWESMLMSPAAADANRDGRITVEEYALWMQSKQPK